VPARLEVGCLPPGGIGDHHSNAIRERLPRGGGGGQSGPDGGPSTTPTPRGWDRLREARRVIRYAFRDHPTVVQKATSDYLRDSKRRSRRSSGYCRGSTLPLGSATCWSSYPPIHLVLECPAGMLVTSKNGPARHLRPPSDPRSSTTNNVSFAVAVDPAVGVVRQVAYLRCGVSVDRDQQGLGIGLVYTRGQRVCARR
jgi:hypothetical protein